MAFVVIFRATLRAPDAAYDKAAVRLRALAFEEFGCLDFQAFTQGLEETALSWWPSEAAIAAWRAHPEHRAAQAAGRERWYASYSVEVAEVVRSYHVPPQEGVS